ncbi:precorrin-2 dehydrogenase/sirohydrochlorin ferrochelatase family protein [Desulfurivibrio dismutans]|uniref:precorrin-2 dehydrogenase/sirohydrochlorin ferrochelatase family protein n=1 Tax=Desulfurivibrio dismutans TaxID=1398908 RepID=UPI0023DC599C|nr:bifunctional precorrin-2 dehydrogenase/sirohydrochlorin ferrochelatase [Desulfurivibrio alkaliphilus]MDF1614262.1 bifunctional precorrin-2 dehydrogenase/sirohydrochlorin ferrochelatase [Desulfurivibrio alkaliphilus]
MGFFPVCLQLEQRPCIVVGGGEVARRKVEGLLACGAAVKVVSPQLQGDLARRQAAGEIDWLAREYREGDLAGAFLVIAATDDQDVQARVHAEAERDNLLLNVADVPKWCNLILPAVVRRGEMTIAISTGGASPALAGKLRRELEECFGFEYEALLCLLAALRPLVLARGGDHRENKKLFKALVAPDLAAWIREGRWEQLGEHVRVTLGGDDLLACVEELQRRYAGSD